ncbi:hypothetical protein [Geobacter sp. AOG2]|uniref:hypothetical protein n=1 Tax=Geobacter sp. AOG2 TaxID=1566347 RepID=UPI001CC649D8|nr:hypothetical protein [Geobacter sp. AOG2]GFE61151.1 hypothetical protein AOG2_17380 [Geobacter sp. AOG2]
MPKRTLMRLMIVCLCLVAPGCTYRSWYAGFQEQQRQECYKNLNPADTQRCLDKANSMTYDQYKAEREQAIEKSRQ